MTKNQRAPVVVVLGHVDHGKTTLLDYIRKSQFAQNELGGITQSIGAYEVTVPSKDQDNNKITFIDTPGHEAFSKLRLHGANVADIAVLIIDAVDSIMPQTSESIFHIKNANIPFIVAINKIDLPGANIDKVKKNLLKENIQVEGMGGTVPVAPISAKTGEGVAELLETILFMASMNDLTGSVDNPPVAFVIESGKDKRGVYVAAIIKDGQLKVGDTVYSGEKTAKIKALISDTGQPLQVVQPSRPFVLLGFKEIPDVGEALTQESTTKTATPVSALVDTPGLNIEDFFEKEANKKLKIIVKTDSQGSLDALMLSLNRPEQIEIILSAVGEINKSDIFLAKVSGAIIIGFNAEANKQVQDLAKQEKVIIKTYKIIYELIDELTEVSSLMAEKQNKEKSHKGEAKLVAVFVLDNDKIAGAQVLKGKLAIGDKVEIWRGERLIGETKIVSLKQRAKTVNEVKKGDESGMLFYPVLDFGVGDMIKSYSI